MSDVNARAARAACRAPRGFTLIELIVTIAIVAILAGIAFPSFAYVLRSNRVSTQANDLLSAFNLARNEAITRSRGVTICAADTTTGIPTKCGGKNDWKKGWIVIIDDELTGAPAAPIATKNILRSWVGNDKNSLAPATDQFYIRFTPRGEARLTSDVTFNLKPGEGCSNQQQRKIVITPMGRSSSEAIDCS